MGAVTTAAVLAVRIGVSAFVTGDGFLWLLLLIAAGIGAIFGGAIMLTWENISRRPSLIWRVAVVVLPLSVPVMWKYQSERWGLPRTLAQADSTSGQVLGRNIAGRLVVVAHFPDGTARFIAPRKLALYRLCGGDRIGVYFQREAPHRVLDVSPPGPDPWIAAGQILALLLLAGLLVAGYGPRVSRWAGRTRPE